MAVDSQKILDIAQKNGIFDQLRGAALSSIESNGSLDVFKRDLDHWLDQSSDLANTFLKPQQLQSLLRDKAMKVPFYQHFERRLREVLETGPLCGKIIEEIARIEADIRSGRVVELEAKRPVTSAPLQKRKAEDNAAMEIFSMLKARDEEVAKARAQAHTGISAAAYLQGSVTQASVHKRARSLSSSLSDSEASDSTSSGDSHPPRAASSGGSEDELLLKRLQRRKEQGQERKIKPAIRPDASAPKLQTRTATTKSRDKGSHVRKTQAKKDAALRDAEAASADADVVQHIELTDDDAPRHSGRKRVKKVIPDAAPERTRKRKPSAHAAASYERVPVSQAMRTHAASLSYLEPTDFDGAVLQLCSGDWKASEKGSNIRAFLRKLKVES